MKFIILLIIILFIIKQDKCPHRTLIRWIAKTFTALGRGFHRFSQGIVNFWSALFMEFSCTNKDEAEEKLIREDFAHWVSLRKMGLEKWRKSVVNENSPKRHSLERRIMSRIWVDREHIAWCDGGPGVFTVITWLAMLAGTIVFIAC